MLRTLRTWQQTSGIFLNSEMYAAAAISIWHGNVTEMPSVMLMR
jgi:hypothetical protein